MKKLTSLIAILLVACVAAQAGVLFQETYVTRRGSSNIEKIGTYWPYASQWFEGYEATSGTVSGNQFDNDYTAVNSGFASIRAKKLNESASYSAVLYFQANKSAYCKFVGALPNAPEGAKLHFEIATTESDGTDLSKFGVKVNETELTIPETTMPAKTITTEIALDLPVGQLDSIKFSLDNDGVEKVIARFWITDNSGAAITNVTAAPAKATKVIENGQLYIIRNGVKYNAAGAIVK